MELLILKKSEHVKYNAQMGISKQCHNNCK